MKEKMSSIQIFFFQFLLIFISITSHLWFFWNFFQINSHHFCWKNKRNSIVQFNRLFAANFLIFNFWKSNTKSNLKILSWSISDSRFVSNRRLQMVLIQSKMWTLNEVWSSILRKKKKNKSFGNGRSRTWQ